MAYQTGTFTDVHDLINTIRVFATANGWTQNKYTAGSGEGTDGELYINDGTNYVSLKSNIATAATRWYNGSQQTVTNPTISVYCNTGFNTGSAVDAQPGSSKTVTSSDCVTQYLFGPGLQYWIFTNATGDYIHVVTEAVASQFSHFGFGALEKIGTYTGGFYGHNTYINENSVYVDEPDSQYHNFPWDCTNRFAPTVASVVSLDEGGDVWHRMGLIFAGKGTARSNSIMTGIYQGPSLLTFNSATVIIPIQISYLDGSLLSPLGRVQDVRLCYMKNISERSVLTLGTDDWLCFPVRLRRDPTDQDQTLNTGWYGFAYKRIT